MASGPVERGRMPAAVQEWWLGGLEQEERQVGNRTSSSPHFVIVLRDGIVIGFDKRLTHMFTTSLFVWC